MGYCMNMQDSSFYIPKASFSDALAAIKGVMNNSDKMHGASYEGGKETCRWYSWVNTDAVLAAETLQEAMCVWRWKPYVSDSGDIEGISFFGEKSGQDEVFFRAIAPFVKSDSYICMHGEDGAHWRWYFDGFRCLEQNGKVVYEAEPVYTIVIGA